MNQEPLLHLRVVIQNASTMNRHALENNAKIQDSKGNLNNITCLNSNVGRQQMSNFNEYGAVQTKEHSWS